MAKAARYLNEAQKEFCGIINGLCGSKAVWQVWTDFLECTALSLSNCFDRPGEVHDEREKRYLEIVCGYTAEELDGLTRLAACTTEALMDNPNQDFLGEMYTALDLNSHWHGQFFTPYHISHFMARITISKEDKVLRERGWIGIHDPACGAGSLLIAARNVCAEQGIGYREALFTAQDVDRVVALMCYIQLSLLGCAGYVVVGNSLTQPASCLGSPLLPAFQSPHDVWFTPVFYDEGWQDRIRVGQLLLLVREALAETRSEVAAASKSTEELLTDKSGQLRIF